MRIRELVSLIRRRRAALSERFDLTGEFERLEESCVPSYIHANPAASATSWWRLLSAARLHRRFAAVGPILDFGAATGELFHNLKVPLVTEYHFVEQNAYLAESLQAFIPEAVRQKNDESLPKEAYAAVFALDSLEHNKDIAPIIKRLTAALAQDGILVVSGPTENWLYRLGRRLAGFSGHYHLQTVYDVERQVAQLCTPVATSYVPMRLMPLFRISVWRKPYLQ
jgi:2-polyprenyl-3-methyl-5-hydroxy-6-metoxy-1,4-benzoquinol methylase